MSHWNHRVVKKVFDKGTENEESQYSIREVFYNDDGTIFGYTSEPIDLACETPEALREYINWCLAALDKPFLIDGEVTFVDYAESEFLDEDEEEEDLTSDDDAEAT